MTVSRLHGKVKRLGKGWLYLATAIAVVLPMIPHPGWSAALLNSPLFEGKDLAGDSYSLAAQMKAGKTTVVYFWALRCAPCLREMAALDEIYKARQKDGLEILAIEAAGNTPQRIVEILDRLKDVTIAPSYPILPDPDSTLSKKFSVQVTPRTFLINKLGEVVYSFDSFSGELRDRLSAGIDALLSGREFSPDDPLPTDTTAPIQPTSISPQPDKPDSSESITKKGSSDEEFEKNRYFGDFYFNKEEYDKAIAAYLKCIQEKPENIHVRLKLGEAYAKKKMFAEAREAWEAIFRFSPKNAEADAELRRLLRGEF